jgi:Dolichyl-phosphate-mannose-protein mannosyltransferase
VLLVAVAELVVQVASANGYGYHRDELYFRAAGRHPAFGYDDQPPLTPLLGWLSEAVFGETPRGLRVPSAIAVAVVVVLVALLARELGAGATGQLVAASMTAVSAYVVVLGHLLSTSTFDLLAWTTIVLVLARILSGGDERLWLVAGAATGIGLQNKHLPLLLVVALVLALAVDGRLGRLLRSRWLWAGAALAAAVWLPNALWQATHGWPQLELAQDIREEEATESRIGLLPLQLVLVSPLLVPVWAAGLWALLRNPSLRVWRALGLAYPFLVAVLFLLGGKPYYSAPLLVCLLAPGGLVLERWLRSRLRAALVVGATAASAAVSGVLALPLVPVERLHATPLPDVNEDAAETVGWPELVRTVAAVHAGLTRPQRSTAVIFTGNYGEAGAIDRYGPRYGLPRAYSGHNAYARFGIPPGSTGPVIVIGYRDPSRDFAGCREAARIDNGVSLANEEQGGPVFVCERPRRPWADEWMSLRHLDA